MGRRVGHSARARSAGAVALALALALAALDAGARDGPLGDWRPVQPDAAADAHALPIDERAWAARLVEELGLAEALPEDHGAEDVFGLLCPEGLERRVGRGGRRVAARPPLHVRVEHPRGRPGDASLRFVVSAPATSLYVLAVTGRGGARWAVDRREIGSIDPTSLGMDVADLVLPLSEGPHEIEAFTAPGTRIDAVELSAFRPLCIAPDDGWGAARPLRFGTKARTLVRAFGLEGLLPARGEPIAREGESFEAADPGVLGTDRALGQPASGEAWAVAREAGEMLWRIELERPGLFSLAARVHGAAPQLWTVDDRYAVRITPEPGAQDFAWTEVVTLPLDSGEHVIRARVGAGAGVDRFQLVQRSASDEDYLALLDTLGFREGAAGEAVTPAAAERNLRNPGFVTLTATLLQRIGGPPGSQLGLLGEELERFYLRPLSPVLPGEVAP